MVAQPHEAVSRHNELLKAAQDIAALKLELQDKTNAWNAQKMRADRAEAVNRQLEAQLQTDKREALTLIQDITMPEARTASDKEYADYRSQGWTPEDITISTIVGEVSTHFKRIVTLIRVAPLEPAHDQPPITAAVAPTVQEVATVPPDPIPVTDSPRPEGEGQGVRDFAGLWNALYQMDRYAELVLHWPQLPQYAPRVYDVFAAAGCDMADVVIMKSFRPGRRDDQWTLKAIFPCNQAHHMSAIRKALADAGFERVIARDGREFIFDLPQAWVSPRTVKADAVIGAAPADTAQVVQQQVAEYEIPPYQTPPIGMTRDERIEFRLDQIRTADKQFISAFLGGQQ